jgi:hypothetical protein
MTSRSGGVVDAALRALAVLALAGVFATAVHDVSQAWDSGYYHLPFAARLAGILPPDVLVFHPANAARFAGYPLLAERLQGALWALTGRPECANLVAFASVPLLAWLLRARFGVPPHLSVLALLAIPLVQTHASSAYVDLPANAAASALVLVAIQAHAAAKATRGAIAIALVAAAVAANAKAQLHVLVALALVALAVRVVMDRAWSLVAALAVASPIVFATPLVNLAQHGNPYYPLHLSVLGHVLPGPEAAYASSPAWLEGAPRPLRFAVSLAEVGIRPITDERRWTVDQWMPDETGGNRLGGFFGAYVALALALLAWLAVKDRAREVRVALLGFAAMTCVVALMPQSHELRYYMSWMIVLVAIDLWLVCRARHQRPWGPRAAGLGAAWALLVVIASTRGWYVVPRGSSFAELVAAKVDPRSLEDVKEGERVCVVRAPWNLLWAAPFHPGGKRYVVVEAEALDDCGDARLLR